MRALRRLRAIGGLVADQITHDAGRTLLAILGITLAVLSTTLLASVGFGVLETGQQKFDQSGRDLWVTGGPVELAPGSVGGIKNSLYDAHAVSDEIAAREDVRTAVPMSFQAVYVSPNGSEFDTIVGVGTPVSGGETVQIAAGTDFRRSDIHYANGSYDGPMTHELLVSPQIAERYDLSVGDRLYVGGTIADARRNAFTVVGISPTYSRFLGAPTVALHLSELQEVTGTTGTDSATWITVKLTDDADVAAVQADLEREYPQYTVRTNREQMESILSDKAVVLAAAAALVVLAVVAGLALTVNLMALLVYQQRTELAALKAVGLSAWTLVGLVAGQGIIIGALGGALGLALTPPAVAGLNAVALELVGFENLLRTPGFVLAASGAIALGIGTASAMVAGWRVARLDALAQLRG